MKNCQNSENKIFGTELLVPYYSNSKYLINKNKIKRNNNKNLENEKEKSTKYKIIKGKNCIAPLRYKDAYEKADIESNIINQLKSKNYQNILEKDKKIRYYLASENNYVKKDIYEKKLKLKEDLTKIINDSLSLSRKTNRFKTESANNKKPKKNETQINTKKKDFLDSRGIYIELNDSNNNYINIDIDKSWNYIINKTKGKNKIDDLKYQIVNSILNLSRENGNKLIFRNNSKINQKKESKTMIKKKNVNITNEIRNDRIKTYLIPYQNNRLRMIDIINRNYNKTIPNSDKNESQ